MIYIIKKIYLNYTMKKIKIIKNYDKYLMNIKYLKLSKDGDIISLNILQKVQDGFIPRDLKKNAFKL